MRLKNIKGSVLITLIIAMVLMAFLGLGIYNLFTSSAFSELMSNKNDNAYQLAKAGIRYAVDRCSADPSCFQSSVNFKMPDDNNIFNLVKTGNLITSTGIVNEGTFLEARRVLKYTISPGIPPPPTASIKEDNSILVGTQDSITRHGTEFIMGGDTSPGVSQSYGAIWYNGNSTVNNCSAGVCRFNLGLRAYFEFQFPNDINSGDGFTFAIMSALTNTNNRAGGFSKNEYPESHTNIYRRSDGTYTSVAGGELMGYAGPGNTYKSDGSDGQGLRPPKMAVEFDTYYNGSGSPLYLAGTRNDQTWSATSNDHVALMFWGDSTLTGNTPPLTYSGGGTRILPLSSFDNNVHGAGQTGRVNGLGAIGYFMEDGVTRSCRTEITRPTSTDTSGSCASGTYKYTINVWIEQTNALSAFVKSHIQDVLVPFTDTSTKISQYACFTQAEHDNFANIYWGFTQGTGNNVQQVPINNNVVFFPNTASTCSYARSPASATYSFASDSGSVAITTTGSCYWAVQSLASWITFSPSQLLYGLGNGTISYNVAPNPGPARIGYINIAGQTFTVNQAAAPPTCTLTAGTNVVPYNGTNSLTWSVSGGTATAAVWTASPGGTCGSPSPAGGSCTTAAQTTAGATTYTLTVSNASGSNNCSNTFYVGCAGYRVWSSYGSTRDFLVSGGTCHNSVQDGDEITNGTPQLTTTNSILNRYSAVGNCATYQGRITYTQAMNADIEANGGNHDCTVSYESGDTAIDH